MTEELIECGMDALVQGRFEKAAWALDSTLFLAPHLSPTLWQRGLACFYGGRYEEGRKQFEADMKENENDVEEVIWNFLCRCRLDGFERARADGFLPLSGSPCVPPMLDVLKFFQGEETAEEVLSAGRNLDGSPVRSYNNTDARAYAHFYIGFFYEMQGNVELAEKHLKSAAEMENPDYIGRLMGMHYELFRKTTFQNNFISSFRLGDTGDGSGYSCSSIIQGGWQLSEGHVICKNLKEKTGIVTGLLQAYDAGIRTFDCGDIYTGVEEVYGQFIRAHRKRGGRVEDVIIHTKLVPDVDPIHAGIVDDQYIRSIVRRSLNRLGVDSLHLVQLHWWDYSNPGYLQAAKTLVQLSREGVVKQIGVTNFDQVHTKELVSAGIPIASTQVQYSLLDRRPLQSGLVSLCKEHNIKVIAYGVLAGGFLTDAWLGTDAPSVQALSNRSLVKYLLIIQEFGGWGLYQELLQALRRIADRHASFTTTSGAHVDVTVAMVAIQYILSQNQVGGVIIGASDTKHIQSTVASTALKLTVQDVNEIEAILVKAKGPLGSVYELEREFKGPHGRIMKFNLNQINQGAHLEELCHRSEDDSAVLYLKPVDLPDHRGLLSSVIAVQMIAETIRKCKGNSKHSYRFLQLQFEAKPEEATRTGYRLPLPKGYHSFCQDVCSGKLARSRVFDLERYSLLATIACNYDHSLHLSKKEEIAEYCTRVQSLLQEAKHIHESILTPDQLVDHKIIVSQLKLELVKWQKIRMQNRDPGFYLPLNAILYLLPAWGPEKSVLDAASLVECSHPGVAEMPVSERLVALLFRLQALPKLLQSGWENLTCPVQVFVNTALETCSSFRSFLKEGVLELCTSLASADPSSDLRNSCQPILDEIAYASKVAAECIEKYEAFIRDNLLPKASSSSGIGKELYRSILLYDHFIESSDQLLALGERHFMEVKTELQSLAKQIDPSKTWQEITESVIRPKHPQASDLLLAYMAEIQHAKEHMIIKELVSPLPYGEKVLGIDTPKFLVPFSPFGDFLNPSPFAGMSCQRSNSELRPTIPDLGRVGHLMLHSVEAMQLPKEEEEKLLRAHDYTWISVIAPHETYPGHHVQSLFAQTHPRVLRKYYESVLFYEGWGLYTEELAYETGFFEKDQQVAEDMDGSKVVIRASEFAKLTRLTQLRLRLWRAARVILDVKLNTGQLSFDECQEFLQREVMFNPRASRGEVFMYISRPGYAICYVTGFIMLMELRERMMQKSVTAGQDFSMKTFHDTLLSKGCIPFKLLEMLL